LVAKTRSPLEISPSLFLIVRCVNIILLVVLLV
jgi:hypothetical protein